VRKVLREFDPRPSGLVLPGNQVVQRIDGERISRVAWKIVRGLYFHHHNEVLRAKGARWVTVTPPNRVPPDHFLVFVNQPDTQSRGQYPGVFDYKLGEYPPEGHYWALLFWDRIIVTVAFHDPSCTCGKCELMRRRARTPPQLPKTRSADNGDSGKSASPVVSQVSVSLNALLHAGLRYSTRSPISDATL
jgi:hypothetical protein